VQGRPPGRLEVSRSVSSLMRGSAITARSPLASTVPSTELSASLLTTSAAGRWARVTEITSSSSLAGATRCVRRLDSRSITRVSAMTEHRSKGQIGQPAACMIESKRVLGGRRQSFSGGAIIA